MRNLIFLLIIASLAPASASAALLTYTYTGTVTGGGGRLGPEPPIGASIEAVINYDPVSGVGTTAEFKGPYGYFFPSGVASYNSAMYSSRGQEFGDSYVLFAATLTIADTLSSGRFHEDYFWYNPVHPEEAGMNVFFSVTNIAIAPAVPEPSTWAMLLIGFAGIGFAGYRNARRATVPTRP